VFIMTGDLSPFMQEGNRIEAAWGKLKALPPAAGAVDLIDLAE